MRAPRGAGRAASAQRRGHETKREHGYGREAGILQQLAEGEFQIMEQ